MISPARVSVGAGGGHAAVLATPFAKIGIRIHDDVLVGIDYLPMSHAALAPIHPLACETVLQIGAYLEDPEHRFDLPLRPAGTPFQHAVWMAIAAVPVGTTTTYGNIAVLLGSAPRAVGGACGSNPIPLIVPCHRVVSASGNLGGFMHSRDDFPLSIKRWLLAHEMR